MRTPRLALFARTRLKPGPVVLTWGLAGLVLWLLDRRIDVGIQAMILVVASAVGALWSSRWVALLAPAAAAQLFLYANVPPRFDLAVSLEEHGLLMAAVLAVSWIVSLLMTRQREISAREHQLVLRSEQLRRLGDALREADDPLVQGELLRGTLMAATAATQVHVLLSEAAASSDGEGPAGARVLGTPDAVQLDHLQLTLQGHASPAGNAPDAPGTQQLYLAMRGRRAHVGAAALAVPHAGKGMDEVVAHAQALCDLAGLAIERSTAMRAVTEARAATQLQAMRNTFLAAISHDHRTPLATILGAASSLHDQDERLSGAQRQALAHRIVEEASALTRLTDNTLALARLDSPGLVLEKDWESVEEIVGAALQRARRRGLDERLKIQVEPRLPLLSCSAELIAQLLDNLIDNARKYAPDSDILLQAARLADALEIAVHDRGPGVAPAERERIFDVFQRGQAAGQATGADAPTRDGAGVGLALCRAIARVHGAELRLDARAGGGASFVLRFGESALATGAQVLAAGSDGGADAPRARA